MKSNLLALALAATLSATGAQASAPVTNLIDVIYGTGTGSFENGNFVPRGEGSDNFQSLSGSATTMIGWTVGGVGVDWLSTTNYGASDGVHAVDLGWYVGGAGSVSINLTTVQGATYALSFSAAAVSGNPTYTNTGTVSAGSLTANFAPAFSAENAFASQVFYTQSYQFIANSSNTVLTIAAATPGTSYGPVIDDVRVSFVSAPVPEPETYALMLVGLGLVGFAARRRSIPAI
jgi:hypothetical protein